MTRVAPVSIARSEREPAGSTRARLELWVTALGGLVVSLCGTMIVPIIPELQRDLGADAAGISWTLTAATLMSAVSVPVMGRLGDMYGKKKLLVIAVAAAAVGSFICAISATLAVLLIGRVIQGMASAAIPLGISLLSELLPPERESSGIALVSAMLGIGGALGLPLAGAIAGRTDYHVLFWITGIVAVIAVAGIVIVVPESTVKAGGRLDPVGGLLLTGALVTLLLALTQGQSWGWLSLQTVGLLILSGLLTAALIPFELRHHSPTVDVRSARQRPILLTNTASVFVGFSMFTGFVATAAYVEAPLATGYGFGSTVMVGGLVMLPGGLVMLVMSFVSARLIDARGPKTILIAGCLVIAAGFALRLFVHASIWQIILGASVGGVGGSVAFAAMPKLILAATDPAEKAAANGLNALARYVGMALASAISASLSAALVVRVAGSDYPSETAYNVMFIASAVAALVAAAVASQVPTRSRRAELANPDLGEPDADDSLPAGAAARVATS